MKRDFPRRLPFALEGSRPLAVAADVAPIQTEGLGLGLEAKSYVQGAKYWKRRGSPAAFLGIPGGLRTLVHSPLPGTGRLRNLDPKSALRV